jgi:hypothetical protein
MPNGENAVRTHAVEIDREYYGSKYSDISNRIVTMRQGLKDLESFLGTLRLCALLVEADEDKVRRVEAMLDKARAATIESRLTMLQLTLADLSQDFREIGGLLSKAVQMATEDVKRSRRSRRDVPSTARQRRAA